MGNFQIDNLVNENLPVVLGSAKYYKKKLFAKSKANLKVKLSEFYRIVKDKDLKRQAGCCGRGQNRTNILAQQRDVEVIDSQAL